MSTRRNKMQNLLQIFHHYRTFSIHNSKGQIPHATGAKPRHGYSISIHQGLHLISSNGDSWRKQDTHMVKNDMNNNSPPPPTPASAKFNFSLWAKWLLGSILSLFLPFWKQKREKLKQMEGEAEMVIEDVEKVAEVVEKVATAAEKVSAEVAEILPDHTKLKDAAFFVERVSKETAHDAQLIENFIHKTRAIYVNVEEPYGIEKNLFVDLNGESDLLHQCKRVGEVKQGINDLEKLVEPVVDKIMQQETK